MVLQLLILLFVTNVLLHLKSYLNSTITPLSVSLCLSLSLPSSVSLCVVMADGSSCPRQMVFGVVTSIDLLNYITTHERRGNARERTMSECSMTSECSLTDEL